MFVKVLEIVSGNETRERLYSGDNVLWTKNDDGIEVTAESPSNVTLNFTTEELSKRQIAIWILNDHGKTVERIYKNY